ncbi:hypothetical protein [Candidatus Mycoplasma haematominutum]|uniref:hypothetical protein n=1 Tax=Candidatus Mycoplasma haematominutum TaxID=209446 RepID=UPI0002FB25C7|nr:hypothetical protein [Candidatus Mycoplasma haematominutum]
MPKDILRDTVCNLGQYVLSGGIYFKIFREIPGDAFNFPLERSLHNDTLRNLQRSAFDPSLSDNLIQSVFKFSSLNRFLERRRDFYLCNWELNEEPTQKIKILGNRTINYLRNWVEDAIPHFDNFAESNSFLINRSLIYLYLDSRSYLSDEVAQKIYSIYMEGIENSLPNFENITKLIAFNPRLNIEYALNLSDFPEFQLC